MSHNQMSYITNDFTGGISVDSTGIYSNNFIFSPDLLFPKTHWKGVWIWLNKMNYGNYQHTNTTWIKNNTYNKPYRALFRKKFIIEETPSLALLPGWWRDARMGRQDDSRRRLLLSPRTPPWRRDTPRGRRGGIRRRPLTQGSPLRHDVGHPGGTRHFRGAKGR